MIKINVKRHPERGNSGHVESVNLLTMTDDVIILHVNMSTKNKGVDAYGGATDEGFQSVWIGMDEIQMKLPERFKHNNIFSEPGRYETYICIFRFELLEKMSVPNSSAPLWESPEE